MSEIDLGRGGLRAAIQAALSGGLSYNEAYSAVSSGGIHVTSDVFAAEYRFSLSLQTRTIPFTAKDYNRTITSADVTPSTIAWPDNFAARVKVFGRDLETGRFANRYVTIGYTRLPKLGSIADAAMTVILAGSEHYQFEVGGVSAVSIESSAE